MRLPPNVTIIGQRIVINDALRAKPVQELPRKHPIRNGQERHLRRSNVLQINPPRPLNL